MYLVDDVCSRHSLNQLPTFPTGLVLEVLCGVGGAGITPDISPVLVCVNAWVGENQLRTPSAGSHKDSIVNTHVDRGVIHDVVSNWQVDPLALRRKPWSRRRVALNQANHIAGTDTTLEEDPRRTQRSSRENDTTIRVQRNDSVSTNGGVVGLHAGDGRPVTDDIGHIGVIHVRKVRADFSRLEVGGDGTSTFATNEVESTVSEYMVLVVGVVVDCNLGVALTLQELRDDVEALLEVALTVSRRMVRAGKAGFQLGRVGLVVGPALREAGGG